MRPIAVTKQLAAASANAIALSQTLAAAGKLTLNGAAVSGGVATLDTQRRVILTSAGNDSALTWTVSGTNDAGQPIRDSFAGGNAAAAQSNLDFRTVTQISGSAASASTVTAGTNGVGSSPWQVTDAYLTPSNLNLAMEFGGTATATAEYTPDEVLPSLATIGPQPAFAYAGDSPVPTVFDVTNMSNLSANTVGQLTYPIRAWRLTIESGTGQVTLTGQQAGLIQG